MEFYPNPTRELRNLAIRIEKFFKFFTFYRILAILFLLAVYSEVVRPIGEMLKLQYRTLADDVIEVNTVYVGIPDFIQRFNDWDCFCKAAPFKKRMTMTPKSIMCMKNLNIRFDSFDTTVLNSTCGEFDKYKNKNEVLSETLEEQRERELPIIK